MQDTSINDLGVQCLLHVFSCLPARSCGQIAAVQRLFRDVVADELIWEQHLHEDFAMDAPVGPARDDKSSHRSAYAAWASSFGGEYAPYIKRAAVAWQRIESFLAAHLPEAKASLRAPASEQELQNLEQELGITMPAALKVLYRLHDGQDLVFDAEFDRNQAEGSHIEVDTEAPSMAHGIFGGYEFYQHLTSVRMLPLRRMLTYTTRIQNAPAFRSTKNQLPFAANFDFGKVFAVDAVSADIRTLTQESLVLAAPHIEGSQDGVLRWFEEYAWRLSQGWYEVEPLEATLKWTRGISLFPKQPPGMHVAVTRGVQVRASSIYVPEMSRRRGHVFTYCIRFSLLPPEQQLAAWPATAGPARALASCQLLTRHWVIRDGEGKMVDEIRGDAVVGKYPLLQPGKPEFVYQSCTNQDGPRGAMEGDFGFVEGSIREVTGPEFDVRCPRFALEVPDMIY